MLDIKETSNDIYRMCMGYPKGEQMLKDGFIPDGIYNSVLAHLEHKWPGEEHRAERQEAMKALASNVLKLARGEQI